MTVELVLEASARRPLAQSLRELWSFRGTILAFGGAGVDYSFTPKLVGEARSRTTHHAFFPLSCSTPDACVGLVPVA